MPNLNRIDGAHFVTEQLLTAISAPVALPPAGSLLLWIDSATGRITTKNNVGAVASYLPASGVVANTLYEANTIVKADVDDTPVALFVGTGTFIGRKAAGTISAMTPTDATALLDTMVGDSGAGGTKGLAPAPAAGDAAANKFLRADGTWVTEGSLILPVVSPPQVTANTNDWNPAGLSTAQVIRFSADAARDLTGITAQPSGRAIHLVNVGASGALKLKKENANSLAANRFSLNTDMSIGVGQSVLIWYDIATTRWLVLGAQLN